MNTKQRSAFSSKIGFVLAAASSAVGLGNLWRFPYLAAKYGGGIFLLTYVILAVTFGFALLLAEIAIGRKTRQSSIGAFRKLGQKSNICGILGMIIPMIITPYYCTIGGWVTKYFAVFLTGQNMEAANDGFFSSYIGTTAQPILWMAVFLGITAVVVFLGVDKGIEKASVILMPVLLALIVIIAVYVVTRPDAAAGLLYYLKPDVSRLSGKMILGALGQLFYSLSIAMGIMLTYGSYMKKEDNLETSVFQIEFFDSFVAILAGMIIVPSVYIFSGGDESMLNAGPGLMFITLPKVFDAFPGGRFIGLMFFALTLFAALTSSISLLEAVVSNVMDRTGWRRTKTTVVMTVYCMIIGTVCSLGYGAFSSFKIFGMSILDLLDFVSNSILMPVLALLTCIFVGYIIKPQAVIEEVEQNNVTFHLKKFFYVLIRYLCPIGILAILVSSILSSMGAMTI